MKHVSIEQKLAASRHVTNRRSIFTSQTMAAIQKAQTSETFDKVVRTTDATKKEHLLMQLRKKIPIYKRLKPAYYYSSLASVVAIGGTVATIALWPTPTVTQTSEIPLPSGNHIVGYDTQNCNYFAELKSPVNTPTHDVVYYEIRKGSSLTDQQLRSSLQGVCEENASNNAIGTIVNQLPKGAPGMQSTQNYIIKAISPGSMTIALDPHYSAGETPGSGTVITLTHFASNLLVYSESSKAEYSDLKVGESVVMVIGSNENPALTGSYNPLTNPNGVTVYGIMSVPALTGDPDVFYMAVAKDLVRVEPCKSNAAGFCEAYGFAFPKQ